MSEERDKRKLSAVLSADVKGYSRLMGEDESGRKKMMIAGSNSFSANVTNVIGPTTTYKEDTIS